MNKEYALKAIEEFLLRERAKVRITSKVSRSNEEASFGKAGEIRDRASSPTERDANNPSLKFQNPRYPGVSKVLS